jgi:putative phosphoribosyl transferase
VRDRRESVRSPEQAPERGAADALGLFMDNHEHHDEGSWLAAELSSLVDEPVVLGVPRGGMVLADTIARKLHAPLDLLVAGRVESPRGGSFAALAEGGVQIVDEDAVSRLELPLQLVQELIQRERERQAQVLACIRGTWPPAVVAHRSVILVDDAVISGLTIRAAIASVRRRGAWRVVVATPLCATEGLAAVSAQIVRLATIATISARRTHASQRACPRLGDVEIHDLIAREHRDVGVDSFGSRTIDGTAS